MRDGSYLLYESRVSSFLGHRFWTSYAKVPETWERRLINKRNVYIYGIDVYTRLILIGISDYRPAESLFLR